MTINTTTPVQYPFYYDPRPRLIHDFADPTLTVISPVIAYWAFSLFFHLLDVSSWEWLEKYRIHESEEVRSRNLVGKKAVVVAVILQQVIQTLMGLVWLEEEKSGNRLVVVGQGLQTWEGKLEPVVEFLVGLVGGTQAEKKEVVANAAYFVYWWGVPSVQLVFAMFLIDTWQYALHRTMHANKWLYKSCHSWHHRLYVPYAFGALYNHPVEGFLLDTLGAALAEWLTMMTTRQAMILFLLSTLKTVDDHCGYSLPWDPLQMCFGNNADYHDIHHQVIGLKSNFSQPFFVHWDTILGTKMTRKDIERRKKENSAKME